MLTIPQPVHLHVDQLLVLMMLHVDQLLVLMVLHVDQLLVLMVLHVDQFRVLMMLHVASVAHCVCCFSRLVGPTGIVVTLVNSVLVLNLQGRAFALLMQQRKCCQQC